MAIRFEVLGPPGGDNALYAAVDTGKAMHRLLFDCGEGCLDRLPTADVQSLDAVFFSHYHFDHIGGFDSLLRRSFYRTDTPLHIVGPQDTLRVMQHRLQGVTWNLVDGHPGRILVSEFTGGRLRTFAFKTGEQFATSHEIDDQPSTGLVWDRADICVQAFPLQHGVESMAYRVQEKPRSNINTEQAAALGLRPGPWMQQLKGDLPDDTPVATGTGERNLGELRAQLLTERTGESLAYLTDFRLDDATEAALLAMLAGCQTIVCENNYAAADAALAEANYHMTTTEVARIAVALQPERLVLFHLSDRYPRSHWREQLAAVAAEFPAVEFPAHWRLE
ncbi:MBL fold metallo-hydrolase [Lignipirellula cremea]|uniref:Ribonuclease Z n=1 Tax=Lignipirellula cremea TaxID=2528010 RepID=A0A518E238_9BACT|nr:MBL fold metallo-hydrolase [Lignipirellula cremea]QDU98166.1 Ribonuclease Z [Lignipirellula cremea]